MLIIKPFIISLYLISIILFTESHASSADSLFFEYSKKLKQHKHFTAEFTQTRHITLFKKPLHSTGTLSFSYPDKILFHYKTPFESIILFSNNEMKRYRIENGKYIEQPSHEVVAKAITREVMRYLGGEITKESPYNIKHDSSKPHQFILIPTHSMAKSVFSSIELTFSEDLLYIEQVKLTEHSGDYILIKHETPSFEVVPDSVYTIQNE